MACEIPGCWVLGAYPPSPAILTRRKSSPFLSQFTTWAPLVPLPLHSNGATGASLAISQLDGADVHVWG